MVGVEGEDVCPWSELLGQHEQASGALQCARVGKANVFQQIQLDRKGQSSKVACVFDAAEYARRRFLECVHSLFLVSAHGARVCVAVR